MESKEGSGQKSQPQETKGASSDALDKQIEELLKEAGCETIAEVQESLEDAKERMQKYANKSKLLQSAKSDLEQFQSILQKHAQLVQKLLGDQGFNNIEEVIEEKENLEQELLKLPQSKAIKRKNCQEEINQLDEILRIANRQNPKPKAEQLSSILIQPESAGVKNQNDQQMEEEKMNAPSVIKSEETLSYAEPESLFQREMQDAQDHARFMKSAPDCFEKSVKLLTHILYQKLDNKMTAYDKFLDVSTSKYNNLIDIHLTNIKETFVREVIKNNEIMTKVNSLQHPNGENTQQIEKMLSCLKSIQPLTCRFNFQEFFSYIEKADEVSKSLANCQNKCIVLLLGTTGAGKSTTIHYVCGSQMYETQNNGLKHIAFGKVLNQDLIDVKVSPYARSETRYIRPINIDMKQLGHRTQETITLVDTPGLFDLKNAEVDVSNQLGIVKALSEVASIRPFLVFSYKRLGARGEGLKEILNFYAQMIVDSRNIDYFNFFFSHVDKNVKIENLKARIIDILDNLNMKEKTNERLVKFLEVIIDRADDDKLFIIDPLNKNEVLKILKNMTKTEEIPRPSSVFQKVICEESSQRIIEQFDLHAKAIQRAFKQAEGNRVEFMLSELKQFCEIMDSNQDFQQRLNDILKKLSKILNNKYDEVVSIFSKQLQPGNTISQEDISTYESTIHFSFSIDKVREKFLCEIDGSPNLTRSYQNIEQEVERLIMSTYQQLNQPHPAKLDQLNLQDYIQKLEILANSQIKNFVSIKDQVFQEIINSLQDYSKRANDLLGKIMTLEQVPPNEYQNQIIVQQMYLNQVEEVKEHFEDKEKITDSPLDQFANLMKELEKAEQITKIQKIKDKIKIQIDSIVSNLKKKLDDLINQNLRELQRIDFQHINNLSNLAQEELDSQAVIQINEKKVECIQKYYQFLEIFIRLMTSNNLSQTLISLFEGNLSQLNDKIIFWYSVQEEKLKRKISQDRKYSAIKSIYFEIMLVKDLPALKRQTMRSNRIKMQLKKLVTDKTDEAKKYMGQIEQLVNQQYVQTSESKENQKINYYTLVSLKDAISTIKELKWTVENGNEDIYDELKDELKCNLQKLVILIEENLKQTREDAANKNDIGGTEQAFKQISEIQSIAEKIDIKLQDINVEDFIPEIENILNGCEKFLANKEVQIDEEQKSTDNLSSNVLLKKSECDKLLTFYTYLNKIRKNDFMIRKIDEISKQNNASQTKSFSERVKKSHEKLEEFVRSHMQQVNQEFYKQLNFMKQYLKKIETLTRNDEGFYENEDHENKASQYLDEYLENPVNSILEIFKMIRELKLTKYHQLWSKLSQNEEVEEDFRLQILKFYREIDEGIARARDNQVHITNSLIIIKQLIPLDQYIYEQTEQERGKGFQTKYDEYFKSLCNFHDQVVNKVEELIKLQNYDEIKENLITLQRLDGKDQLQNQKNMKTAQQKLQLKCKELSRQIFRDTKYLLRDKQLDADKIEELNKKSQELQEILRIIGERFLTQSIYKDGQQKLEYFQTQISSNFEKIQQCIKNQIKNNSFSEAHESILNYQNSARNIDFEHSISLTGDKTTQDYQKDYFNETTQLLQLLIASIDEKYQEFKTLVQQSSKSNNDDSVLKQIKEKSPREIIENLQKSENKDLKEYAQKIIDEIKKIFDEKIANLQSRLQQNDKIGKQILSQINDYLRFCSNFPEKENQSLQAKINDLKQNYLNRQNDESVAIISIIESKKEEISYINQVYDKIVQSDYSLDQQCQIKYNDFYRQQCQNLIEIVQRGVVKGIEEKLYQLWLFQSSEQIQSYLDSTANNAFQSLQKIIQDNYQQTINYMNALFQKQVILSSQQNSFYIQSLTWYIELLTHKTYQIFANQLIPFAGETLIKVIEFGLQVFKNYLSEFSRVIKSDDPIILAEAFNIISFMRSLQQVQELLLNDKLKIILEQSKSENQQSALKHEEFVKFSNLVQKDKFCEQLASKYKTLQEKEVKDSQFFDADFSQIDFEDLKKHHIKLEKYLIFVKESHCISEDLLIYNINTKKFQLEWEEKIKNYHSEAYKNGSKLLGGLETQKPKLQQINNLFEAILITESTFKSIVPSSLQELKKNGMQIVKSLGGKMLEGQKIIPKEVTDLLIKLQDISQNVKQLKERAQESIEFIIEWLQQNCQDQKMITQIALMLKQSPIGAIIVEQQSIFICEARTFWANRIEHQDIKFVLENLQTNNCVNISKKEKEHLKKQYDSYLIHYEKLVENNIVPYDSIPKNKEQIKIQLLELTQKQKLQKIDIIAINKIQEILACLFALWTLSDFHKNKFQCDDPSKPMAVTYLLKPHPAQVISILRILGHGYDQPVKQDQIKLNPTKHDLMTKFLDKNILFDNLVQIKTGEGKSITLAMVIAVFALWGFEVSCACYSQYLSQRDFQQFKHLFEFLNINEKIFYGTFNQICERYINKDGDIRNLTLNRILKDSNIKITQQAQADKRVILIDEVDVFFSQEFFNKMYVPIAQIKNQKVSNLLDFIWENRSNNLFTFKALQLSEQYKECVTLFKPEYGGILDEACKEMFSAAQNFLKHDCVVQNGMIGYHEMEQVSFKKSYGYNTIFAHYHHLQTPKDGQKVSQHNLDHSKALEIHCGQFSYAEIPLYSMLILGVTGTLDSLSASENKIINDVFQIRNFTYSPSVYGLNKLKWKDLERDDRTKIFSQQEYFMELTNEIKNKIKANGSYRAVLVFFKTQDLLKKFKNSNQYEELKCQKQDLTEQDDDYDKESKIIKATYQNTLTLTTRSFGRGTDFICRDEAVETNGGVHVILTFVPEMQSEFIQIQGRTARQGNSGSFQMILLDSDLQQFGIDVKSTQYIEERKDKLELIIKKRDQIMLESQQSDAKAVNEIKKLHQEAIQIKDILVKNDSSNSAQLSKYLIKINKGPLIEENQKPVKTLILMDATGSMSSFLTQAKNSVNLMYERSGNILQQNGLDPQLNYIQFACYRNYSSKSLIFQNSPWQSRPDQLKVFMDSISVSGGIDNEAIEIGFQHAVSEALNCGGIPLRQVFLIGDIGPNTKEEVDDRRKQYPYWVGTKFEQPAYWDIELGKLKDLKVQVNTFYVHPYAKQSFEQIAKMTGGTCNYLDVTKANSQEILLELFHKNIFQMIGHAAGDKKIGEKLVADYLRCYK